MITYRKLAGSTDVSVVIRIVDSTDGTPETGVVFNTSGIDLEYRREGEASTDITEATLAALTTAHTDGGFLHIGNGYYRLDLPDAACATGVAGVLVHGTVTGMVVIGCYIQLEPVPADVRQFGGTAGTFSSGRPEVNATHVAGTALSGGTGAIPGLGIVDKGTAQSATGTTLVLRSAAAFADDELIGATIIITGGSAGVGQRRIITDYVSSTDTATVDTWTTTPTGTITYEIYGSASASSATPIAANVTQVNGSAINNLVSGRVDASVGAMAANVMTAAAAAADLTTELQGGLATAANLATVAGYLDTEIAAILALLDDPRTEPGQGAPPVNPDLATKIDYLYKAWRNRSTQTASEYALYADDGTTKDQEAACSDDGTTFVRGEVTTGA